MNRFINSAIKYFAAARPIGHAAGVAGYTRA